MKRIGRLWLLAVLALALLCMPQAAWAADTFTILVDGENANGQTYQLDRSGTTPYLSVEVDAQGVWAGCSVTWSSSDEKVAIVDGTGKYGVVYPQQGSGSATITARAATGSGLTASRSLKVAVYSSQEEKTVITLRNGSTTLKEGETLQLICDVSPAGTPVAWSSSAETVATVDQTGLVTGHKAGKVQITVTAQDGSLAKDSVTLTVSGDSPEDPEDPEDPPAGGKVNTLKLSRAKAKLYVGGVTAKYKSTLTLKPTVKPAAMADSLTWSSSNPEVATVKKGRITAHKVGKATIRVKGGGKSASCVVQVAKVPTRISLPAKGTMRVGTKVNLAKQLEMDGTVTKVQWKSSNGKVAKVSAKGVVLGVKPGKARIRVTTVNGKTATCLVTVTRK